MTSAPDAAETTTEAIALGPRMARSARFEELFGEGIKLVEEAASYLDGPGRLEAATLAPGLSAAYAAESMRLTSRLMQLASWLMLRRSLARGEISPDEATTHRVKVATQGAAAPRSTFLKLPVAMQRLTERSLDLQRRVLHLDRMVETTAGDVAPAVGQGPAEQLALLRSAFGGADL